MSYLNVQVQLSTYLNITNDRRQWNRAEEKIEACAGKIGDELEKSQTTSGLGVRHSTLFYSYL